LLNLGSNLNDFFIIGFKGEIMKHIKLQPRKAVLGFRMMGIVVTSLITGSITGGICFDPAIHFSPFLGLLVGFIGSFLLLGPYAYLYFNSIQYVLTERYVSKSSGVIWKRKRSVPLDKITNIDVSQGPFERMMGFGQIWIYTPSTGALAPEEKLIGISAPHDLKGEIVKRAELSRETVPVESQVSKDGIVDSDSTVELLREIKDVLLRIEKKL
jgi:uncharacterized membrane protein YdbT with pleckstrin-like domain